MGNVYSQKLMPYQVLAWLGIVQSAKHVMTVGMYFMHSRA
jgi:hypothetical protein